MNNFTSASNPAAVRAIKSLLAANEGRIFSVQFVKKDGSVRDMQARLGVKKDLAGGENSVQHIEKYLTAYDMQNKGYRNINLETLRSIKMQGISLTFGE